jgi:hypothetical protein
MAYRQRVAELSHARVFLEQLAEVMPAGWRVVIDDDILWLVGHQGKIAGSSAHWLIADALLEDEAVLGATQSLHQIQQEITEATTEPWPARSAEGYRGFPEPDGELAGNELHLWFGEKTAPVLVLKPIDLGDVIVRD